MTTHSNEEKQTQSRDEVVTPDSKSEKTDFGGESTLPPPPKLTPEEDKQIWRKIDKRLMPILSLMYLLSFLDRGMRFL